MLICEEGKYHVEPSLLSLCRPRQNFVSLLHCNIYIIHILNMNLFHLSQKSLRCFTALLSFHIMNIIMFMKYFHLSYRSLHWGQELPEKEGGWSQKTLSQRSEIGQKTIIKRYLNVNGIWNRAHIDIWTRAKHNYWKVSEIEQNTIILIWQIYWKEPEEIWRRTATKLHEFDKCIERNKVKHVLKGTRLT